MIGDLRLSASNMQPHSFSKGQLTAIALMLDEEAINLGSKVFWNSENQKENTGPCTENWVMTK
jgi:hypothetical protein